LLPLVYCFDRLTIEGVYPRFPPDTIDANRQILHKIRNNEGDEKSGDFNALTVENTKWLDRVTYTKKSNKFIKGMINTPGIVVVNPITMRQIDASESCWIIMVYKSSTSPQTPTKSLIATLAETFYERCGVALADVDYPANKLLFESFLSKLEKGPFLLVKSPYKDLQMLKTKFYFHQDNLQPIDEWGFVIDHDKLERNVLKQIHKLVEMYLKLVKDNLKIKTIYMNHYKNDHKRWMRGSIKRIEHAIHDEAMEHAESGFKCKSDKSDCTKVEVENDLTEGEARYMSRRTELNSEVVGWSVRHLITEYINAGIS